MIFANIMPNFKNIMILHNIIHLVCTRSKRTNLSFGGDLARTEIGTLSNTIAKTVENEENFAVNLKMMLFFFIMPKYQKL